MHPYLWINITLLAIPLALSFIKRVSFYRDIFYVLPSIIIPAAVFIFGDYFFVAWGVWKFNPEFLTRIEWFGLPMEEIWFFITMPYLSLFIYAFLKAYIEKDLFKSFQKLLTTIFLLLSLILFFAFPKHLYTSITALLCAFLLLCHSWISRPKSLGRFYLAYFISLIPFLIARGILTAKEAITFDPKYIIGFKIFSIPVEDILFFLALFLMNVGIYEYLKRKKVVVIKNEEMKELRSEGIKE